MWCLRMWGLRMIVYWPSKTEGVGTSHLKLIWERGFKPIIFKPHILKHHIPEHPIHAYISLRQASTAAAAQRGWSTSTAAQAPHAVIRV